MESRIRHFQYIANHPLFEWYSTKVLRELAAFSWYSVRRPWKKALQATHEWAYRNMYDYEWWTS